MICSLNDHDHLGFSRSAELVIVIVAIIQKSPSHSSVEVIFRLIGLWES